MEFPFTSFFISLKSSFSTSQVECFAIVWWFVWYARNGVIFRQESSSPRKVGMMIKAFVHNLSISGAVGAKVDSRLSLLAGHRGKRFIRDQVVWTPPPADFFKLNFDGSKLASGQAAFGFVIHDSEGIIHLCGAGNLDKDASILEAEARGLREGLRGARSLGITNLMVEGDNLAVINAIKQVWKIPWTIHTIIVDTVKDLGLFEDMQVSHVFREANAAADWMAHRGHSTLSTTYWFDVPDLSFAVIIRKDALGWPKSWDPP
ncbi:uncharacterized protein LOC104887460 [Beta vulgaris subsp. vulgaris]|uniref:uncharacterized protein LOC104887460 n=1 Tax=Beta vulgaris subsp. vulgaris TaxID=3555 RepID=UPI0020366A78|nr:uncharacterized protein LOC104887460 [Beta vulgaris subsp. vulgaris]